MKAFDHEWILEAFAGRSTFFTKRMFGGLAAYVHERLMLVLVEPTKTGRWKWHGVLIGTAHEHHASIRADFPALAPHGFLLKWLYIDSADWRFESTMEAVAHRMAQKRPAFRRRAARAKIEKTKDWPAVKVRRQVAHRWVQVALWRRVESAPLWPAIAALPIPRA